MRGRWLLLVGWLVPTLAHAQPAASVVVSVKTTSATATSACIGCPTSSTTPAPDSGLTAATVVLASGVPTVTTNKLYQLGGALAWSGANVVVAPGSSAITTVGTVTTGTWLATLGAVSGAALTNLNASAITTGTINPAVLPTQGIVPAGAVLSFNLAACPAGWTPYTPAQGRYIVGLVGGGTLNGTVGTPLGNTEARAAGAHSHSITDVAHGHGVSDPTHGHGITDVAHTHTLNNPAHGHTITDNGHAHTVPNYVLISGGAGSDWPPSGSAGSRVANEATTNVATGVTVVANTTAVTANASGSGLSGTLGASTGISIVAGGSGLSTTNSFGTSTSAAPYIQLLMCQKS